MLQICVIDAYNCNNVIFDVTFSFFKILLYSQKFAFMNNVISFRQRKRFIFENNEALYFVEIYLI